MKKFLLVLAVLIFFTALLAYPWLHSPLANGAPPESTSTNEITIGATLILLTILTPILLQIKRWR